jgi:two-component sensor histidine kinase
VNGSARAFVIDCQTEQLVALRNQLGSWLDKQQLTAQLAFEVKLVVHEAAKNAIDHSQPCDRVKVYANVDHDEIVVQVVDTNAQPWEPQVASDQSELRGLDLIRALTRQLSVVTRTKEQRSSWFSGVRPRADEPVTPVRLDGSAFRRRRVVRAGDVIRSRTRF